MSKQKPGNHVPIPDIESSLSELFHAPSPETKFVEAIERSLLTRARQESLAPTLRQRFSVLFSTTSRGMAWGVGALLLIAALAWGIRNLIPAVLPAGVESPTPAASLASPVTGNELAEPIIAGTFSGLDNADDLVTFQVRTPEGQEPLYGTQRGNGPWEATLSNAQDGDQFTVTAEAVGYIVSPASYAVTVQDGQVYLLEGDQPGQPATTLHFAFFHPAAETMAYTNAQEGFTFTYPGDWSIEEAPHYVFLRKGPFRLMIAFRRPEESHQIQPTGLPSGELVEAGSLQFLDQEISRIKLVNEERVKKVLYNGAREIQFKDIAFVLMLDAGQNDYAAIDIPEEVRAVTDQVLESFSMPGIAPLPPILSAEGLGRVAYMQDGDIWAKPLPEGEALRLTQDGLNFFPRWSPSGTWLAYIHGESQVNLVRADGSSTHTITLSPVAEIAWSPTADRLAFTLGGERQGELWVVNADGTLLVNVVAREEASDGSGQVGRAGGFLWHPLGGKLIYEWWVGAPDEPFTYQGIWEANSFNGEQRQEILNSDLPAESEVLLAGWLAQGKLLLVWKGYQGSASAIADGAPLWQLPYAATGNPEPILEMLTHTDYFSADPTNTGRLVAISGMGRETWAGKGLFLYDYTARTGGSLTGSDLAAAFPAFSPDGTRLAYSAMPVQETDLSGEALRQALLGRDLWLFEFQPENPEDPGSARQLTNDPAYRDERPEWSADGTSLVFPRQDATGNVSLWQLLVDGGEPVQLIDSLASGLQWFGYYGYIEWNAFYDWWQPPAAAPDEYPPQPALPETIATPAAALEPPVATFSEPEAGYTFDYPQGWYLNSVPGTTEIGSSDPHTWALKGSLPAGETQVLFANDAALKGYSFVDVRDVTFERIGLAGETVLREENWQLPGGDPAVRLQISGPSGEYAMLVTVLGEAPLQVYGYGDLALFDAIIATLRPSQ